MLGKFYPMRKGGKKYFWETGQQGRKLRLQRGQHHRRIPFPSTYI
jgi:hypothetical protein